MTQSKIVQFTGNAYVQVKAQAACIAAEKVFAFLFTAEQKVQAVTDPNAMASTVNRVVEAQRNLQRIIAEHLMAAQVYPFTGIVLIGRRKPPKPAF